MPQLARGLDVRSVGNCVGNTLSAQQYSTVCIIPNNYKSFLCHFQEMKEKGNNIQFTSYKVSECFASEQRMWRPEQFVEAFEVCERGLFCLAISGDYCEKLSATINDIRDFDLESCLRLCNGE